MAAGLYIHIPFCFSKCPYCDFYSTRYTPTAADAFAEKLGGQMQDYTGSFDTVYFGGGTPSILEPRVLTGILQAVRDHFAIDPAAEITVECNPSKDLTGDMEQYAAAGINRVSIGMQSAVDRERFALGRRAGSVEVARTVAAAKAAGITNISLDVMLGTPKQTPDSLEETFAFIARMQVTHISAYLLKIEPGTPFDRLQAKLALPEEDTVCQMYLQTVERLGQLGFTQYEISNFARPGHEGRHNLLYWNCSDYWGVGPAAHSCVGNVRQFWPDDVQGFIAGTVAEQREGDCTSEDYLLMQLRLVSGLNIPAYERRGGRFTAAQRVFMRQCVGHGYAVWDGEVFRLTPAGMVVQNAILEELI